MLMSQSHIDLSSSVSSILPQSTACTGADSNTDNESGSETDDESLYEEDIFSPITEPNAFVMSVYPDGAGLPPQIEDPDPVGEGANVAVACAILTVFALRTRYLVPLGMITSATRAGTSPCVRTSRWRS